MANKQSDDTDYLMIDTYDALVSLCDKLAAEPHVVMDTEFMREKTFRPHLCLIQIKAGELLALVDSVALTDLSPLKPIMANPNITKVMHAAGQDLEAFYWLFGEVPVAVFDTQLAAPLIGFDEQAGYATLVKEMLGVNLSKSHTRTDWSKRPLSQAQIRYALDDVTYLEPLYLKLREQLSNAHRLEWLVPEFEALSQADRYHKPSDQAWLKIRAVNRLQGKQLAYAQLLAKWREETAQQVNRPRNWLLKDDALISIARLLPASREQLQEIRGLDRKTMDRHADELVELARQAQTRQPQELPAFKRKQKLTPMERASVDLLKALVALRAAELDINADLLGPVRALEACVQNGDTSSLTAWRAAVLKTDLEALLNGQLGLALAQRSITRVSLT